jgi:serine/threonine protein kinase
MGVVYEAEDQDLNRRIALKVIPEISATVSAQLRSEARAMACIEHANLARIYGLETWRGVAILVLELLGGGTLAARLGGKWEVREALMLGVKMAEALHVVHRSGVVHRDVKPSNIGFTVDGAPKLLDFGIARMMGDVTPPLASFGDLFESTVSGTPGYLSPEALQGDSGPPQDLWALAMVLYQVIAGLHPLAVSGVGNSSRQTPPIPDLREFRGSCSESVARFFGHALSLDPSERPQSARVLSRELTELLEKNS